MMTNDDDDGVGEKDELQKDQTTTVDNPVVKQKMNISSIFGTKKIIKFQ